MALKPLDLTYVQFVLLEGLWRFDAQGRCPSQRELADQASTDVMMTSQVARVLEDKGLLRRAIDPRDARKRVLTITGEGRELAENAVKVVRDTDDGYFAGVPDRGALLTMLTRLVFPGERRPARDGGGPAAR
jgi:DNA-binding MarR family transcriptional regulator